MEFLVNFFNVFSVPISAAVLCGGMVGLERQLMGKPAGLRVCILVVLTSSFFMTTATQITQQGGDLARVLAGIITGVGFLGAGVIFRGKGHVAGITTACLIWMLAAVGCTIGLGYAGPAIAATILVMIVLALVDLAEHIFPALRRNSDSSSDREGR